MLYSNIHWILHKHSRTFFEHSYLKFTDCYFLTFIEHCTSIQVRSLNIGIFVHWMLISIIQWALYEHPGMLLEHSHLMFAKCYFQTIIEHCTSIPEHSLNIHIQCLLNVFFKHSLSVAWAFWNVPWTFVFNVHWTLFSNNHWALHKHSGTFPEHSYSMLTECFFQIFIERYMSVLERSLNIHI